MAKRTADNQKTKDDVEEEGNEEPGIRAAPLAAVEGRPVRGLPKRRGLGGASAPTPTPAPAPVADIPPAPTSGTSSPVPPSGTSNAFTGFSFGASTSSTPSFSFGQSSASSPASTTPAAAPKPFAGFSFGSAAATGSSTSAPVTEPTGTATPAFSFSQKPVEPTQTKALQPSKPFAGFSFGAPAAAAPSTGDNASEPPRFSFGAKPTSDVTKEVPAHEPIKSKAAPFSFGTASSAPVASGSKEATQVQGFSFAKTLIATATSTTSKPTLTEASETAPAKPSFSFGPMATTFGTGTAPTSNSAPPAPAAEAAPAPSTSSSSSESETSYYTSLRGLNQSFLTFFSTTIEKDQFIDLTTVLPKLLVQYEEHLTGIETKAGWKPDATSKDKIETTAAPEPPKATGFTLPKAPSAGSFSLPKAPSTSSAAPATGGFTPSAPATAPSKSSIFSFPAADTTPKKSSDEVNKIVSEAIADKPEEEKMAEKTGFGFSFGTDSTKPKESSAFKFEAPKKSTSLFASSPATPAKSAAGNEAAPLGKFGPGGSQPQLSFGAKAGTSPAANTTSSFNFNVGKPSTPAGAGTSFSFGTSSSPSVAAGASTTSASVFGGTSTRSAPTFSFGATTPSASSSSSFVFGKSPVVQPSGDAPKFGASLQPFGSTSSVSTPAPAVNESNTEGEEATEPSSPSKNLASVAGAGEENEDTVIEQRGKLNRLEDGEYKLEGLGQFKLKRTKNEEDRKRRLLMRTDGNGNVILNMAVKSTFNPSVEGPYLKFLGFNMDGKPTPYALRVKNAEAANTLLEGLKKEVEEIKDDKS
ncbi:hypothetical protein CNA01910 [Cryptococcus deneoformans JEC21]|uniref:RanBD1 domain-containing protein n=1 Tax=Cryptococcus deneoformans (strain JEC21 / ATCC MYA-565) TaxID=214684 RepID=Q5KPQ5_CRYD1|nr:hypothetical protein CNA01910 [Cryptococcus neoformans var. neoformans JEC21]AAW40748.1 hypothetical protein CNA01910 [Cryptococcus neoformans var. neoformans JEC21]